MLPPTQDATPCRAKKVAKKASTMGFMLKEEEGKAKK